MSSWIQQADAYVAETLKSWNIYTTVLAVILSALLIYPLFFPSEPDTHPLLLARQSVPAPIRQKGESAAYRASEVPHGYPLRSGLSVKDASAPRWTGGRDGDLRDIWREVARAGGVGPDGREIPRGLIMRVFGKDVTEYEIEDLTKEIIVLGKHFQDTGVTKLAIYLANDLEYLLAIFACSFYGISPVLFPFSLPQQQVFELINTTSADGLVCAAGALPLDAVGQECTNLKLLTWVVESTSRHMDWSGIPDTAANRLKVSVWHELVEQNTASKAPPENGALATPPPVFTIWQDQSTKRTEIVAFTHANLVAGVAGLIAALPLRQRFSSADLVVPADSFCNTYALCHTFAALYSHASVAVNSVAGTGVDIAAASSAVKPTVIIASAESVAALHSKESAGITGGMQRLGMATQSQAMAAGRMPTDTIIFKMLAPSASRTNPGQLRLLLVSERIAGGSPPITSTMLSDLRIFTKARIAYALTASNVAGAIAQTNVFDYRQESGGQCASFGGPVGSVEVKVSSTSEQEVSGAGDKGVVGELLVNGPAVVGGAYRTGCRVAIRSDGTIKCVSWSSMWAVLELLGGLPFTPSEVRFLSLSSSKYHIDDTAEEISAKFDTHNDIRVQLDIIDETVKRMHAYTDEMIRKARIRLQWNIYDLQEQVQTVEEDCLKMSANLRTVLKQHQAEPDAKEVQSTDHGESKGTGFGETMSTKGAGRAKNAGGRARIRTTGARRARNREDAGEDAKSTG
ncbi:hypothetical protein AMS68_007615 [Peltaster fructicola]|uniref:AMP-dependent synthetase/ligase domain-containing protein n=1 Tax=Peltaster fructicola TaxID=286661 RepID=A0A6H0Y5H8_9PEZI|nr:hypothetical protein AMS68_007615 [Peltaster fructicola]